MTIFFTLVIGFCSITERLIPTAEALRCSKHGKSAGESKLADNLMTKATRGKAFLWYALFREAHNNAKL